VKTSLLRRIDKRRDSAFYKMKQWQRIGQFIGSLCVCCLLLVSCTLPPAPDSPNAGTSRITIGTTSKIRTLDPADAYEQVSSLWINNLGDRLYSYETGTTQLKPQLATSLPKISKDGLTYTIPLRQGVVFHDGTPFNAEAMAFSLRRFVENKGNRYFFANNL
jgi:peptide/nickel transport system substrate-binding protein